MPLAPRSETKLLGVHPDLVRVVRRAAEIEPFIVTCGLRTLEEQKRLVSVKKSRTLNSRHLTGHAIDFADPDGHYDEPDMERIGAAFKGAAKECGVAIQWGGDWDRKPGKIGWDGPHIELTWKAYPAGNGGLTLAQKTVEAVKTKPALVTAAGSAGVTVSSALPTLPAPPDLTALTQWQGVGDQITSLLSWSWQNPVAVIMLLVVLAVTYFVPTETENGSA